MRVPVSIVVLLAAACIGGAWWLGTRRVDFLTPPAKLGTHPALLPHPDPAFAQPADPEPDAPPPVREDPKPPPPPPPDFGDLQAPLKLNHYGATAAAGPAELVRLAQALEAGGHDSHALLAWERVLDHTQAPPAIRATAVQGIQRLRPKAAPWITSSRLAVDVVLQVQAHPALKKSLTTAATEVATILTESSSGFLKFKSEFVANNARSSRDRRTSGAVCFQPIANPTRKPALVTFTAPDPPTPAALRDGLLRAALRLVRNQVESNRTLAPPAIPPPDADLTAFCQFEVTRLTWEAFSRPFRKAASAEPAPEPKSSTKPKTKPRRR